VKVAAAVVIAAVKEVAVYELIGEVPDKLKVRAGLNGIRIHVHPVILKHHRGITALGLAEAKALMGYLDAAIKDVENSRKDLRNA